MNRVSVVEVASPLFRELDVTLTPVFVCYDSPVSDESAARVTTCVSVVGVL